MFAPCAVRDHLRRISRTGRHINATRTRKCVVAAALFQFAAGPGHEFVDIAMVVGEQHETLHMLWRRSEEHTSELQSLMRISYAVFCLKKKNNINTIIN